MKRTLLSALTFAILFVAAGYRSAQGQDAIGPDLRILRGKQIVPVTINMQGKDPRVVYYGSYLVNSAAGCVGCHSCPTYKTTDPYKVGGAGLGPVNSPGPINATNYLAGGVPFGPFVSSNLTPDSAGKPAGLTLAQFVSTIQTGIDPHNPPSILQVMPWPAYRHMEFGDLAAIYAYLSSIPPAQPGTCTGADQTGM